MDALYQAARELFEREFKAELVRLASAGSQPSAYAPHAPKRMAVMELARLGVRRKDIAQRLGMHQQHVDNALARARALGELPPSTYHRSRVAL